MEFALPEGVVPVICLPNIPRTSLRAAADCRHWSQCPAVERIAGKVSGAWLFKDTRVPVKALFENLEGGATVVEFLEWLPGVTPEQVDAVLEHAQRSLVEA